MLQQFAMMSLGYFVFMRSTIPYQDTSREMNWSHVQNDVVGAMPKNQFTGKAGETFEISGELRPEITGGKLSILALEMMAEQGTAYPLISGSDFMILGWFVIERISVQETTFFADGTPRAISFSMSLKRVDDSLLANIIDEVAGFI
ncbi:phage tail protein [Mannheimia haemolytica]|uniref:phage tail protein n=1 Tax=Mannheimia haemolytica TaxID=75985 RepID=UPI000588A96B|nr:phage tail protein [Mannheimia haemolytica]AJE08843.1 oxidoreductase [Mannheimia haemolytica USDA-ARS-USMARC-184]KYL05937.1 oxidoreductase [Mannheimia haemolytica]UFK41826.1 phage tail protein [Mannheimia haemolytica]UFK42680.1 phage tail protein [Mannheimia haemolytica]UQX62413.1 phage tail protein [Mannheimia haemolytica]